MILLSSLRKSTVKGCERWSGFGSFDKTTEKSLVEFWIKWRRIKYGLILIFTNYTSNSIRFDMSDYRWVNSGGEINRRLSRSFTARGSVKGWPTKGIRLISSRVSKLSQSYNKNTCLTSVKHSFILQVSTILVIYKSQNYS